MKNEISLANCELANEFKQVQNNILWSGKLNDAPFATLFDAVLQLEGCMTSDYHLLIMRIVFCKRKLPQINCGSPVSRSCCH